MSQDIQERKLINALLSLVNENTEEVIKYFKEHLECNGPQLKDEASIFSLWLLTVCFPNFNKVFLDKLHDSFCKELKLNPGQIKLFYVEIDRRYKNYTKAYDMWMDNPKNGVLGNVMIEIIKNKNPNFSIEKEVPIVGFTYSYGAFSLFCKLFMINLKIIDDFKKEYPKFFNIKMY
ncbi:MAG: hypothetical protein NT155_04210 [Candidatus Staskawiczbacteria bacterium]|nr:hypothetical protein [Candidatus Staskawiczbacteria bacterium]